jgi:cytochrome d ubiquinol oxidase subunit II
MEYLQITWFALWGILWAAYFMLDGFVLGTGMIYPVVAKSEAEKRAMIHSVGPVWSGNEVWLITAGGATFAAFPTTYALMFSYLYTALLLLLVCLIIRGFALELRGKHDSPAWTSACDFGIYITGLLISLLLGVAFGNIFRGLPMDSSGYHGSLLYLLNPYGLLTGLLFVLLFVVHGSLYAGIKTGRGLSEKALEFAQKAWPALAVTAVAFLIYTAYATKLYDNFLKTPALLIVPLIAVAALFGTRILLAKGKPAGAFAASCVTILFVTFTGIIGLFPNLIPSSLDPAYSLTLYNSSSSRLTLGIMTVVALIFVPIVIAYKIWVYKVFSARVPVEETDSGY